jgi:hypothetical protein
LRQSCRPGRDSTEPSQTCISNPGWQPCPLSIT